MFNPQQSSNAILTSLYHSLNPVMNPNLNLYFPQPVLPSASPSSATDPYGPLESNPSNSGGFDVPLPISEDPDAGSRSRVDQQDDSVTHAIATNSLNEMPMVSVSTGWCNPGNNVLTNHPMVDNVQKTVPQKTKVIQSMRCDICDIDCNSNDAYERHMSGKKHKKKFEMHNNPSTTVFKASSAAAANGLETKRQKLVDSAATVVFMRTCSVCDAVCYSQEMFNKHLAGKKHAAQVKVSSAAAAIGLETKRQNLVEGAATVVFMRVCSLCDVVCNSQEIFNKHLAGKRHAAQARKHPQHGMDPSVAAFSNYISGISPMVLPQDHGRGSCESHLNKTIADKFAWCEVCRVSCTGSDVLMHNLGKKHLRKLENLKKTEADTSTPGPTDVPIRTAAVTRPKVEISQARKHPQHGKHLSVAAFSNYISRICPTFLPQDHGRGPCESDPSKIIADKLKKTETGSSTPSATDVANTSVAVARPIVEVSQGETTVLKNENAVESCAPREDSDAKRRKIMEGEADGMELSFAANPNCVSGISPMVLPQDNKKSGCESGPNKSSADQFARCDICNIFCTGTDVLIVHKLGKKHLKNLEKLRKTGTDTSTPASTHAPVTMVPEPMKNLEVSQGETEELKNENVNESCAPREDSEKKKRKIMEGRADGIEQSVAADLDSASGISHMVLRQDSKNGACESDPNKTRAEEFARCGVCNIYCTSHNLLIVHKLGKKHIKNLEKLRKRETYSSTPASSNASGMSIPVTGPMEKPVGIEGKIKDSKNKNVAKSRTPKVDLETKKRKIMEVGAAGDAVRVCIICNVVCNSQSVLDSHLAGQKHAAKVRKQAASVIKGTGGSRLVAATKEDG